MVRVWYTMTHKLFHIRKVRGVARQRKHLTATPILGPGRRSTKAQQLLRWSTVPEQSGPKSEAAAVPLAVGEGELGLHLKQCRLGRGLPPYKVASSSIQPFDHNTPTLTGQDNGRIA